MPPQHTVHAGEHSSNMRTSAPALPSPAARRKSGPTLARPRAAHAAGFGTWPLSQTGVGESGRAGEQRRCERVVWRRQARRSAQHRLDAHVAGQRATQIHTIRTRTGTRTPSPVKKGVKGAMTLHTVSSTSKRAARAVAQSCPEEEVWGRSSSEACQPRLPATTACASSFPLLTRAQRPAQHAAHPLACCPREPLSRLRL